MQVGLNRDQHHSPLLGGAACAAMKCVIPRASNLIGNRGELMEFERGFFGAESFLLAHFTTPIGGRSDRFDQCRTQAALFENRDGFDRGPTRTGDGIL